MRVFIFTLVACILFIPKPLTTSAGLAGMQSPGIDIQCSKKATATVKFRWKATNANYVLIKGRDNRRYPSNGEFDQAQGAVYMFIAVSGNETFRQIKSCFLDDDASASIDQKIRNGQLFENAAESSATEVEYGAPGGLAPEIEGLLRTDYGIEATSMQSSGANSLIYTVKYGTAKTLCDIDGCKKNGKPVEREIGFDILLESVPGKYLLTGHAYFKVHVTADILVRPAGRSGEWQLDPDSDKIGRPIAERVAAKIGKM